MGGVVQAAPGDRRVVGIELLDGSYVYGALDSYSPQGDETSDRSIVLAEPIDMRRPWMQAQERLDARTFVVAADQIRFITTYYLEPNVAVAVTTAA